MMKLSILVTLTERISAPVRKMRSSISDFARDATRDTATVDRGMEQVQSRAYRLGFAIGEGVRNDIAAFRRLALEGGRALGALDRKMQLSREAALGLGRFTGRVIGNGLAIAGTTATAGLTGALYKIVSAGLEFEKFKGQLFTTEGSEGGANKAMGWLTKFSQTVPVQLSEVTEAFIAARNNGINPYSGALKVLGDTSSAMGRTLPDAVEMLGDAMRFQFERAQGFGISASQKKDIVTLSWVDKQAKQHSVSVKKSATDIREAMLSIMNQRFGGGAARLMETTSGKWTNLMDRLTVTANAVWQGGFMQAVNRELGRMAAMLDRVSRNGSLDRWAKQVGSSLGKFVTMLGNADWGMIAKDISGVADAVGSVASALQTADRWLEKFGKLESAAQGVLSWAINPIGTGMNAVMGPPSKAPARPAIGAPRRYDPSLVMRHAPAAPTAKVEGHVSLLIKTDPGVHATPTLLKSRTPGFTIDVTRGPVRASGL